MAELPLTMPKMSMTMEEGTMVVWLKKIGDPVKSGEPVCEVATDKVDMEVESPFDGVLVRITAQVNDVVRVGDPIGYITTDADDLLGGLFGEPHTETAVEGGTATAVEDKAGIATDPGAESATTAPTSDWIAAVPKARTIAAQAGIDLRNVVPSGSWDSIRVTDVETAAAKAVPSPAIPDTSVTAARTSIAPAGFDTLPEGSYATSTPAEGRRRRTRLLVAKVMSASAAIPQFTAYLDLDLEALSRVRKTDLGGASWTAILVKAQAIALRQHPQLNGFWLEDGIVLNDEIGVALAVDSPSGLLAPVLRNPDLLELSELAGEIAQLVEEVRTGSIGLERLSGGTTVFSNLGGFGVVSFNALLTPPHATALSAGAIRKRVIVTADDAFGVRLSCTVGITVDHRVADGADAARYLATLKDVLGDSRRLLST